MRMQFTTDWPIDQSFQTIDNYRDDNDMAFVHKIAFVGEISGKTNYQMCGNSSGIERTSDENWFDGWVWMRSIIQLYLYLYLIHLNY